MITEDKVTEIFCMADDFCKFFDAMIAKYTIKHIKKENITAVRQYHRQHISSHCSLLHVSKHIIKPLLHQ